MPLLPHETPTLETERLILRPLDVTDAPALQRTFAVWSVVEFLSAMVPWPYPADGAATYIRDVAPSAINAGKEWHWSIRPKVAPDTLIGSIALYDGPDNNRGFWLDPAWRLRGLMREASEIVTGYWFDVLDRSALRVPKAIGNERSRRISLSSGMRVIATFEKDYVSGRLPSELWEITREEWRARRRADDLEQR